jgi:hemerythrin
MLQLEWQNRFSVGVNELDTQHKHLLSLLNQLANMSRRRVDKQEFFGMLNQFVKYAETHFASEERLMLEHGFSGLKEHSSEHVLFVAEMFAFAEKLEKNEIKAMGELVAYVRDWYVHHVLGTDREYVALFAEKGVR